MSDLSEFLRALELRLHGSAHLQTVSVFGSERNTVAPALAVGRLMRAALAETRDLRPVFDSEHGPIYTFFKHKRSLPEPFDDEYFRHIQWAHLASGGVGGGMRWPNRQPHVLTHGMRRAQLALSQFLPLIDWTRFKRRNLNDEARPSSGFALFACGDERQAVAWLLRKGDKAANGMLRTDVPERSAHVVLPRLLAGHYRCTLFDTRTGKPTATQILCSLRAGRRRYCAGGRAAFRLTIKPSARRIQKRVYPRSSKCTDVLTHIDVAEAQRRVIDA